MMYLANPGIEVYRARSDSLTEQGYCPVNCLPRDLLASEQPNFLSRGSSKTQFPIIYLTQLKAIATYNALNQRHTAIRIVRRMSEI
jgi:hypothetical protein